MTFDQHDGHERPRVYVSGAEPRYVAICSPHAGSGRWREAEVVGPLRDEPVRKAAPTSLAEPLESFASFAHVTDDGSEIDEIFREPLPDPEAADTWETLMRAELAVETLRGVEREFGSVRYDVALHAPAGERRDLTLARHFRSGDERIVTCTGERVVVSTDALDDVRFLIGFYVWRALLPSPVVIARAGDFAGVVYVDWDNERFYIAEARDVLLRNVVWAARALGLEVVGDGGEILVAAGTAEALSALNVWVRQGSRELPETF